MKWFPTHKGFAAGIVVVGYGSGALISAPLFQWLLKLYRTPPTFLGSLDQVSVVASCVQVFF